MLLDPHAGTLGFETVRKLADELISSTGRWLPQFRQHAI
jgi:hypothetical protein